MISEIFLITYPYAGCHSIITIKVNSKYSLLSKRQINHEIIMKNFCEILNSYSFDYKNCYLL
jgi:hypothetical protein